MPAKRPVHKKTVKKSPRRAAKKAEHLHKDGSIWAKGEMTDGVMTGYWEWFRKDGTRMRTGYFDNGEQVGEWTTYDKHGKVVKVTTMKPKRK
jgi:antitoxin component YwqK of YwqJK toxin-antitoxin module